MDKVITAHFAATSKKGFGGKVFNYPARTAIYTQDDAGQWTYVLLGDVTNIREADVIDDCKKATNWSEIKAAHFPMEGFHN